MMRSLLLCSVWALLIVDDLDGAGHTTIGISLTVVAAITVDKL